MGKSNRKVRREDKITSGQWGKNKSQFFRNDMEKGSQSKGAVAYTNCYKVRLEIKWESITHPKNCRTWCGRAGIHLQGYSFMKITQMPSVSCLNVLRYKPWPWADILSHPSSLICSRNEADNKTKYCPLTEEWIKKMWYIYTVEYYSAIERNETGSFVETWWT